MELDTITGIIVASVALVTLIALVWWSRRTINRINDAGPASARAILRGLHGVKDGE